jgi:gas vesicle protein
MSAKGYWIAFAVGVTAGAAVALLYAPQSGVKTRKQLRKGVEDAGDYLEDAGDYLKDQAERLTREAQKAYKRGVSQVGDVVDTAKDYADKAQGFARSASKSVSSLV